MGHMNKESRVNVRITKAQRAKVDECARFMGETSGEFVRRAILVMLMVMGDQESKAEIVKILESASGLMEGMKKELGAGLPPVPPISGRVTGTHLRKTPVRRKSGK